MKKISIIVWFYILLAFTSQAQGVYSPQNLEKGTLVGLNLNLEKAHKLKRTGVFLCIAGPVLSVGGIALAVNAYSGGGSSDEFAGGTFMFLGGIITTVVGLPILITGFTREKKVKTAINNHHGTSLNIAPAFFYNNKVQSLYPGVTLKARF
jgi:uncharacterized membrane protein